MVIKNHTTYFNDEWTPHEIKQVEPVQLVQTHTNQSYTYRKDELRVQEKQQLKDQQ